MERAESLLFKVAHEERASDFRRVALRIGNWTLFGTSVSPK